MVYIYIKASPQQQSVGLIVNILWHGIITHIEDHRIDPSIDPPRQTLLPNPHSFNHRYQPSPSHSPHSSSSSQTPLPPIVFLQVRVMLSGGSTGVPRQCFGAPHRLEQRINGLGKYEPPRSPSSPSPHHSSAHSHLYSSPSPQP